MMELAQLLFSTFLQTALAVSYGAKFEGEYRVVYLLVQRLGVWASFLILQTSY